MVVVFDLDDVDEPSPHSLHAPGLIHVKPLHHSLVATAEDEQSATEADERPNPNVNGFSAALSCYP